MSNITVRIPEPLRPFVDNVATVETDADTVGAALERIGARHPGFLQRVMADADHVRPHVNIFVGVDDVRSFSGLETPLNDGDVVSIIPAVAGG